MKTINFFFIILLALLFHQNAFADSFAWTANSCLNQAQRVSVKNSPYWFHENPFEIYRDRVYIPAGDGRYLQFSCERKRADLVRGYYDLVDANKRPLGTRYKNAEEINTALGRFGVNVQRVRDEKDSAYVLLGQSDGGNINLQFVCRRDPTKPDKQIMFVNQVKKDGKPKTYHEPEIRVEGSGNDPAETLALSTASVDWHAEYFDIEVPGCTISKEAIDAVNRQFYTPKNGSRP